MLNSSLLLSNLRISKIIIIVMSLYVAFFIQMLPRKSYLTLIFRKSIIFSIKLTMKIFLDTNIFVEYFEKRREYESVSLVRLDLQSSRF